MGFFFRQHHYDLLTALYIITFLVLFVTSTASGFSFTFSFKPVKHKKTLQELSRFEASTEDVKRASGLPAFDHQERLSGPGSSPPSCRSKCGRCKPCKPVHVPIQPGMSFPLEYYPEAWRCKCGNKLFMP